MSRESVEKLMDRWLSDKAFRDEVRRNPERAIRGTGLPLSPEELAAVRETDWSLSDDELKTRVNKGI